ncbi:MAG: hypothetical protein NC318_14300 [Blautia sp.]|nr:hypothetical protein [Lachnoclostridium sp.]MCM1212754.1 hypothetical protein [Blautia sp.]
MKTKIVCAVSGAVILLSGGILLGLNGFSGKLQQREEMISQKQTLETEIAEDKAALTEMEAFLSENQEQFALYEEQMSLLEARKAEIKEGMEQLLPLYQIPLGGLPINYDVENFREAEKLDAQSNQLVGAFFGKIIEGILSNKEESNVASAESLRLSLYEFFSDFLEESFGEAAAAKISFDGAYSFYEELTAEDGEGLSAGMELPADIEAEELCKEEKEALLQGLAKYVFDLSCVYEMYETTLTEHETAFLANLKSQLDTLEQVLAVYDSEGNLYGYTEQEQLARYEKILYQYVAAVEELGVRNADNGIKNAGKYTDYGVGVNQGFLNRGRIVLMYGNVSDNGMWEPKKFFYNGEGSPIYIKIGIAELIIKDGKVLKALPEDVETYQTEEWQQERLEDAQEIKEQFERNRLG